MKYLDRHDIQLTTNEPLRSKPYPLPFALREEVSKEVKSMLEMGIIEKCDSPYASPVVMVRKSDNNFRLCVDYRKVNKAVVFDAEPMPNPDEIFTKLSKSKYFTKIDLSKGYFQLPLKKSCRKITAFVTHEGLFCFKRLPFGLVTGGASFSRMMRILLDGMKDAENFIDDILLHSVTCDDHVRALRELLTRLRNARLTARPSKCMIGYLQLDFLGHVVGNNQLKPNELKIQAIADAKRPESKKQLRSLLGLVGYYRKFIPNFAEIAVPLTSLTKKGTPNKIPWGPEQENAFQTLKGSLMNTSILHLADFDRQLILRTDGRK